MIDVDKYNKVSDALMLINDARLTRSEAYELFYNLKSRIFTDQPSKVMCRIKRVDFDKAVDDYWDGIYEVPNGWTEKVSDKDNGKV